MGRHGRRRPSRDSRFWTLEQRGEAIRISNSQGAVKIVEFDCALAKECEVKESGKKVKVMVYFNGPKLVMMETRGDQVVNRFQFSGIVEMG